MVCYRKYTILNIYQISRCVLYVFAARPFSTLKVCWRLGITDGRNGKPVVMIASNFNVWLNNPSDDAVNFAGGTELFGFGVGFFEEKEISSLSMDVVAGCFPCHTYTSWSSPSHIGLQPFILIRYPTN